VSKLVLIGMGHQTGVGKDTAARGIRAYLPWISVEVRKFAYDLKYITYLMFKCYGMQPPDYYEQHREERSKPLPGIGKTPLELMIEVGGKGREIHEHVWRDQALDDLPDKGLCIFTDVRGVNEAEAIRERGGLLLKIVRPDAPSTQALDHMIPEDYPWHEVLVNDGTPQELGAKAAEAVKRFLLL